MVITRDLKEKLEKAQKTFLIVPQEAGLDGLCGALALYHTFQSKDREVRVVFDGEIPSGIQDMPEAGKILPNLGSKDLILRFNIGKQGVEKISYSTGGDILSLRVRPKTGQFDIANFDYSYEGANANLLVTFGIARVSDLSFFEHYKQSFEKSEIINLGEPIAENSHKAGKEKETVEAKSISQFIFEQLVAWGITPSKEASICLLKGISL
ncbi:MAG: hypothetical protein ABH814_04100 [bacterium]